MKQNIKAVLSVIGCILVATILSFMSIPITMLLKGPFFGMIINGIVPCLLLGMLIYSKMWEIGWKVPSRRKLYNEKHSDYKALAICAVAFVPSLILLLCWKMTGRFLFQVLFRITNFYCVGFFDYAPNYFKLIVLIVILVEIAIGQVAYTLGTKRISLYTKAVYKKEKK